MCSLHISLFQLCELFIWCASQAKFSHLDCHGNYGYLTGFHWTIIFLCQSFFLSFIHSSIPICLLFITLLYHLTMTNHTQIHSEVIHSTGLQYVCRFLIYKWLMFYSSINNYPKVWSFTQSIVLSNSHEYPRQDYLIVLHLTRNQSSRICFLYSFHLGIYPQEFHQNIHLGFHVLR